MCWMTWTKQSDRRSPEEKPKGWKQSSVWQKRVLTDVIKCPLGESLEAWAHAVCARERDSSSGGESQRTFRLKTWCKWPGFESKLNFSAYGHLDDTTCMETVSVFFLRLKKSLPVTSIWLDLAVTLFTPETPNVFCGLKHLTHPSIGIGVSK